MIEFIPYKNLFLIQINKRYRVIDSWKLNNFSGAKHLLSYAISFSPPPPLFLLLFFFYYLRVCSSFSPLESGWLNTAPYRSAHLNDKHNDKPCGDKRNPVILTGEHRKKKKETGWILIFHPVTHTCARPNARSSSSKRSLIIL